jgi:hypothetical protein
MWFVGLGQMHESLLNPRGQSLTWVWVKFDGTGSELIYV